MSKLVPALVLDNSAVVVGLAVLVLAESVCSLAYLLRAYNSLGLAP